MQTGSPWILNYFKPRDFEQIKEKTIYDFIGIPTFKKYLPTSGDLARRWGKLNQFNPDNLPLTEALRRLELKTRNYEWRHILGAFLFVLLILVIDKKLTLFDIVFLFLLNLYVNIYPVLQRFIRIRIITLLKKNGLPSPYDSIQKTE